MPKLLSGMTLILLAAGCTSAANPVAICDGSLSARADHAAALADEASDRVVVTGARLIRLIDAGCGQ